LLKSPGRIVYELQNNWRAALPLWLVSLALLGMAAYGVVVGSFSGGAQMWIAPAKIATTPKTASHSRTLFVAMVTPAAPFQSPTN
jgi:hypothetical protein